jgi:hypothetical protein
MITPVQKAPKPFADRFNRIYDGEEVIDTVAKLKEFWLFALDQGQEHREMREYIADLAFRVEPTDKLGHFVGRNTVLYDALLSWEIVATMSRKSPYPGMTDEEWYDHQWALQRLSVERIDALILDKKFKIFKYPAAK